MSVKTATTIGLALVTTTLPFPLSLPGQEVIDLPGQDQPLDADFEEVFRVGVVDGEPWEMFGGVRYVGFDASGNLYIVDGLGGGQVSSGDLEGAMRRFRAMLDSDGSRVLVFDASGNFVREFGSGGEGPGEFKMPTGFAVMRDGTMGLPPTRLHPVLYCAWISGTKTCKPTPLAKAGCLPLVTKTSSFRGTSGCRGMPRGP